MKCFKEDQWDCDSNPYCARMYGLALEAVLADLKWWNHFKRKRIYKLLKTVQ